ncbi:MAG: DUF350 domain-containing protein [Chloroherpetonaceae bacterium]|nr:DUF350 domain-containing protein [Chthonomonadaceae bacterium]MDW8208861.1 DUF350 domain-containing protein [Chloroherpetonaceae bacterium]
MKRFATILHGSACGMMMLAAAVRAFAQVGERSRTVWDAPTLLNSIVSTIIFGLLGTILTIVGFKLFDALTPFHLEREVCEKQNVAVALVCAAMMLGISLIIALTILA